MLELVGAVIGAIAVVVIPLVAWSSRRLTKEGRLLLRIERLGSARALMPDSPQRKRFEEHLNQVTSELNEWLDEGNKKRRRVQRRVSIGTYVVGVVAVFLSLPFTSPTDPWRSSVIGGVIGTLIAVVTLVTSYLLERNARREAERAEMQRAEAEQAKRMDALRSGTPIPSGSAEREP